MERRRILVIDDEPRFTRLLKLALEESGRYQVQEENRGAQALAAVQTFRPDLILLDIIMPDQDGATVAVQLEADPKSKDIPIIFLTAVLSKQEVGLCSGIVSRHPVISKPVGLDDLMELIERHLRDRRRPEGD